MQRINALEFLSLSFHQALDAETVHAAYRRNARALHPDAGGLVEDFLNLRRAYEVLVNPEKRDLLCEVELFKPPRRGAGLHEPMQAVPVKGHLLDVQA